MEQWIGLTDDDIAAAVTLARGKGVSVACRAVEARLRELNDKPQTKQPVAWRWLYEGKPDSDKCFPMPGPDYDVQLRAIQTEFPRTVQYLYDR